MVDEEEKLREDIEKTEKKFLSQAAKAVKTSTEAAKAIVSKTGEAAKRTAPIIIQAGTAAKETVKRVIPKSGQEIFFVLAILAHLHEGFISNWEWNVFNYATLLFDILLAILFLWLFVLPNKHDKTIESLFFIAILFEIILPLTPLPRILANVPVIKWLFAKPFMPWWVYTSFVILLISGDTSGFFAKMEVILMVIFILFLISSNLVLAISKARVIEQNKGNLEAVKKVTTEATKSFKTRMKFVGCIISNVANPEGIQKCEEIINPPAEGKVKQAMPEDFMFYIPLTKNVIDPSSGFLTTFKVKAQEEEPLNIELGCNIESNNYEIKGYSIPKQIEARGELPEQDIVCYPEKSEIDKIKEEAKVTFFATINSDEIKSEEKILLINKDDYNRLTPIKRNELLTTYFPEGYGSLSEPSFIQLNIQLGNYPILPSDTELILKITIVNRHELGKIKDVRQLEIQLPDSLRIDKEKLPNIYRVEGNKIIADLSKVNLNVLKELNQPLNLPPIVVRTIPSVQTEYLTYVSARIVYDYLIERTIYYKIEPTS